MDFLDWLGFLGMAWIGLVPGFPGISGVFPRFDDVTKPEEPFGARVHRDVMMS